MNNQIEQERENIRKERRTMVKDAILVIIAAALLATFLIAWKVQITGFSALKTFESENTVTGASSDETLSFTHIPNIIVKVGEEVRFKVEANKENVVFRDDTKIFEITQAGIVDFTPNTQDIGQHNVWIIIKDAAGSYYYQNVVIIIEE